MRAAFRVLGFLCFLSLALLPVPAQSAKADPDWAARLRAEAATLGKPEWRPMLTFAATLHEIDTHPAEPPFKYPWEDTGRGYGYGPGFGHWDLVHAVLDEIPVTPEHVREQLLNDIGMQLPSGFLPGLYWMRRSTGTKADPGIYDDANAKFSPTQGNPPLWVVAADDYLQSTGNDPELTRQFLHAAKLQLGWFERERRAKPDGFLYLDIVNHKWESGVDQGIRFDESTLASAHPNSTACVDATSHVYQMYVYAAKWARALGEDATPLQKRADELRTFIQTKLWDPKNGFFYDSWVLDQKAGDGSVPNRARTDSFEGMWPMVVGAATPEQAHRVIDEWLMNPKRFFTKHPISTVSASDPKFELRMWRGPVWNSMTYWAARGALRYDRRDAARRLLEAALDDTAAQYDRTGHMWEYYHPNGGHPEDLKRKPETSRNLPFPDYLGHNPVIAMTRMWASLQGAQSAGR